MCSAWPVLGHPRLCPLCECRPVALRAEAALSLYPNAPLAASATKSYSRHMKYWTSQEVMQLPFSPLHVLFPLPEVPLSYAFECYMSILSGLGKIQYNLKIYIFAEFKFLFCSFRKWVRVKEVMGFLQMNAPTDARTEPSWSPGNATNPDASFPSSGLPSSLLLSPTVILSVKPPFCNTRRDLAGLGWTLVPWLPRWVTLDP